MELIATSYCGILLLGIFVGYILSRKQDDRTVLPPSKPRAGQQFDDEIFRCMHTPEELEEMMDRRISTDGRN